MRYVPFLSQVVTVLFGIHFSNSKRAFFWPANLPYYFTIVYKKYWKYEKKQHIVAFSYAFPVNNIRGSYI
jgi:hypothetical protein